MSRSQRPPRKLLVAEDDTVTRELLRAALKRLGYDVEVVREGRGALAALERENGPRLAILDRQMPGLDGVEVCRRLRQQKRSRYVYVLLLTASDRKEDVVSGLESGADDYLTKPFHPQELVARLAVGQRILDLEEELVAAREDLRIQASRDSLTGLWNRAAIVERLQREMDRCRRRRKPLALLVADIDHFKRVNDTHGHLAGDRVLAEMADRIRRTLRRRDSVGRYGGEEFLVVLPGTGDEETARLAEGLRNAVTEPPMVLGGTLVQVTLSVGAAVAPTPVSRGWEALLGLADAALYRAKEGGRNRVELAAGAAAGHAMRGERGEG